MWYAWFCRTAFDICEGSEILFTAKYVMKKQFTKITLWNGIALICYNNIQQKLPLSFKNEIDKLSLPLLDVLLQRFMLVKQKPILTTKQSVCMNYGPHRMQNTLNKRFSCVRIFVLFLSPYFAFVSYARISIRTKRVACMGKWQNATWTASCLEHWVLITPVGFAHKYQCTKHLCWMLHIRISRTILWVGRNCSSKYGKMILLWKWIDWMFLIKYDNFKPIKLQPTSRNHVLQIQNFSKNS